MRDVVSHACLYLHNNNRFFQAIQHHLHSYTGLHTQWLLSSLPSSVPANQNSTLLIAKKYPGLLEHLSMSEASTFVLNFLSRQTGIWGRQVSGQTCVRVTFVWVRKYSCLGQELLISGHHPRGGPYVRLGQVRLRRALLSQVNRLDIEQHMW